MRQQISARVDGGQATITVRTTKFIVGQFSKILSRKGTDPSRVKNDPDIVKLGIRGQPVLRCEARAQTFNSVHHHNH